MKVVFRADASHSIGSGHVTRCLTLAAALRERGAIPSFVCREHAGHLCGLIEKRGFSCSRLAAPRAGADAEADSGHMAALGVTWEEDASQTRAVVEASREKLDWLVVDHYAIDHRWEGALRKSAGRIMAIDDLADREHDCDLLLDQNLVAQMDIRYAGKIPATCGLLLGPEYALLQPAYAKLRDRTPPREGPIRRIFIFFSGADNGNLTGRALNAILQLNRPEIEIDAVISAGGLHEASIRRQVEGHGNVHLHSGLPSLAPLMAAADLAIGACGATSWERLCLGLPALVVTLSENQRANAAELHRRGLIRWLGHQDEVSEGLIAGALDGFLQRRLDKDWSLRCSSVVDGNGAGRVSAMLTVSTSDQLLVRQARLEDEALLLAWANDPITRANAFLSESISAETHGVWFRQRLGNLEDCRIYVIETIDGIALGQVRFERREQVWAVDYALAQPYRGRGLGRRILEAALLELGSDVSSATVAGHVKYGNYASRKIFESLGFEASPDAGPAAVVYRRSL